MIIASPFSLLAGTLRAAAKYREIHSAPGERTDAGLTLDMFLVTF